MTQVSGSNTHTIDESNAFQNSLGELHIYFTYNQSTALRKLHIYSTYNQDNGFRNSPGGLHIYSTYNHSNVFRNSYISIQHIIRVMPLEIVKHLFDI